MDNQASTAILDASIEPGVINTDMLRTLIIEQGAKGQAGRLFSQDGIDFRRIDRIRIQFLNILKIDNLWIMAESLTRLNLSNNIIEKIENLESLVNLQELDLSFNHIRLIENLETLVNLEILVLDENEISEICGIDNLTRLMIFSIGANRIESNDHVTYLRRLKKLASFNITGNKCTSWDGYFDYLVAFLPQIEYLNYRMLKEEERAVARKRHERAIANLEEKELADLREWNERQALEKRRASLRLCYVEGLADLGDCEDDDDDNDDTQTNADEDQYLFRRVYKKDKVGMQLAMINDDTKAIYQEYTNNFRGLCLKLHNLGISEHEKRTNEIALFDKIVQEAQESVQSEARTTMEELAERKRETLGQVGGLVEAIIRVADSFGEGGGGEGNDEVHLEPEILEDRVREVERLSGEFNDHLSKAWNRLMYREIVLHEQMEDINETFKVNMTDTIGGFLEAARMIFAEMRDLESEYRDNLRGAVAVCVNEFAARDQIPPDLVGVCDDNDVLANSVAASHELHSQVIDSREDVMISRINEWFSNHIEQLDQNERKRNRGRVLEMSHFFQCQREQFDALELKLRSLTGPDATPGFDGELDG